jgi:hypothetical protein
MNLRGANAITIRAPWSSADRKSSLGDASTEDSESSGRDVLATLAVIAIAVSIAVMIAALMLRTSWMEPPLPSPPSGPPWELGARLPGQAVVATLWLATGLGGAGVLAGLAAVRRGGRFPLRALLIVAAAGLVAMVVLPPSGSTDAIDYAVYGHIAAAGHSPYIMTPAHFWRMFRMPGVPQNWEHRPSVYGPLATGEEFIAAKIATRSLAATVFWLKLFNAVVFAAVAFAAHRLLPDRRTRVRAHLLWTANPLLLWAVIAAGHLDVLAAGAGIVGLLICDGWIRARPVTGALLVGACIAIAADIKVTFALFGLAAAWSLRRQPVLIAVAAGAAGVVLLPSYVLAGRGSLTAPLVAPAGHGMYSLLVAGLPAIGNHLVLASVCLAAVIVALLLWRIPAGFAGRYPDDGRPVPSGVLGDGTAMRVALAISLGWLLVWPEQYSWYAAMVLCVLIFYPGSWLDWVVVAWVTVSGITDLPGRGIGGSSSIVGSVVPSLHNFGYKVIQPIACAVAVVVLLALSRSDRWRADPVHVARVPSDRLPGRSPVA